MAIESILQHIIDRANAEKKRIIDEARQKALQAIYDSASANLST